MLEILTGARVISFKLRDIEILVQNQLELLESEDKDEPTLREIQKILYSVSPFASSAIRPQ